MYVKSLSPDHLHALTSWQKDAAEYVRMTETGNKHLVYDCHWLSSAGLMPQSCEAEPRSTHNGLICRIWMRRSLPRTCSTWQAWASLSLQRWPDIKHSIILRGSVPCDAVQQCSSAGATECPHTSSTDALKGKYTIMVCCSDANSVHTWHA